MPRRSGGEKRLSDVIGGAIKIIQIGCFVKRRRFLTAATLFCLTTASPAATQGPPTEIGLIDLKLDLSTMKGQTVKVTGILQLMGEMVVLKSEPLDMTPIWINASHLSRAERKSLLTTCSVICKATITGRVGYAAFGGYGLDALTLENVVGVNANTF